MKPINFSLRLLSFAVLAISIGHLSAAGQNPKPVSPEEEIRKLERQILILQDELKALQDERLPVPKLYFEGVLPESWVNPMRWRCIGPAIMGGRITSIAVAESEPTTYWVATASGGLLKTVNNGTTFEHQFDREATVSIGAVAVAPSNKDIVWVGTGEANPRNSVSYGDGVYKSVDGGKSWKNMGLKQSFQIGKIIIHPKNPDIVYVGALGRLYGPNPERGLFKTTDGGKTWDRVLYINDMTGIIDVVMHSTDPETLIVAAWERQRDEFDSFRGDAKKQEGTDEYAPAKNYAAGSAIYRTTNGGKSFDKLAKGLPDVKLGRIGLDFSRQHPDTVFAIVDSEKAGMGNKPPPPSNAYLGMIGEDDPAGVRMTTITEKGPADKAGMKTGDIVTRFAGRDVKTYDALVAELRKKKPDDKVKATILRDKNAMELEITLGTRPVAKGGGGQDRPSLGIQVDAAKGGVLISEVIEKSPADKAGLKVEDIITHIDGTAIEDRRVITKALFDKKVGDKVKVNFNRGKDAREVLVTLEVVRPANDRPNSTGQLGGQVANAQGWQGPDGDNTGGLYKSTDKGETWTRINSINPRPFYFSVVRVDPNDDNIIYVLGVDLARSTDGGKRFTYEGINAGLHADQHDLWINPKNSKHLLIGVDGGLYVSYDRAANWEHLNRMALGQFYHVCVDNRRPYRVFGGLQDNGSWGGPSNSRKAVGPTNEDWIFVNGGDGFYCQADPVDPDLIYSESQNGNMARRNLRTGNSWNISPQSRAGLGRFRFNWNTPMMLSRHNPSIFYAAGNYVFRSVKQGDDLRAISPEITRTKRGSGTALAESPKNAELLWVGTDDGAVHLTRDGGRNWTNLTSSFLKAGLPGPRWVASIEASKWAEGRAYVVFDAHRSNDDEPYVFVTEDYGQNWKSLRANLPSGSTRVLREDAYVKDLLYLGTEFGIWASINRGDSWTRINSTTLPTVAVHEIAQPTTANEIVVATHGRSVWVLDVSALRQMTPAIARGDNAKLFSPSAAVRWQIQPGGTGPFAVAMRRFIGQNPQSGATIDYVLPKRATRVTLKIEDVSGRTMAELKTGTEAGLHRINWNLQVVNPPIPKGVDEVELRASPFAQLLFGTGVTLGTYRVVLTVDGVAQSAPLTVEADPNVPPSIVAGRDESEIERALNKLERKQVEEDE